MSLMRSVAGGLAWPMDGYAKVAEAETGQCFAVEAAPARPGDAARVRARVSPPPPDTVVVASFGHAFALVERARASEAALRAEAAAEVARLTRALREQKTAHMAEIGRLRAEHAAGVRRLVETCWRGCDAARNGTGRPSGPEGSAAAAPQAPSPARPRGTRP